MDIFFAVDGKNVLKFLGKRNKITLSYEDVDSIIAFHDSEVFSYMRNHHLYRDNFWLVQAEIEDSARDDLSNWLRNDNKSLQVIITKIWEFSDTSWYSNTKAL